MTRNPALTLISDMYNEERRENLLFVLSEPMGEIAYISVLTRVIN